MAIAVSRKCPSVPDHGDVFPPKDGKSKYYCPHHAHDGRMKSHPRGVAPATKCHFTKVEVETGEVTASAQSIPVS